MRNPKFLGVYSRKQAGNKGGPLARGPFYFVWELPAGDFAVQELDKALTPKGRPKLYASGQLRALQPEPSILAAPISVPDFRHLAAKAASAPAGEISDAELAKLEKARKSRQVENELRSNFQKALRALNRPRDRRGALAALEQIASVTEGIMPEHKHMFRDFGVSLRKKSLPELALGCAKRVVELAPDDDHAHFNVARILSAMGLYDQALAHMQRAMSIDAGEPLYGRMVAHIRRQGGLS